MHSAFYKLDISSRLKLFEIASNFEYTQEEFNEKRILNIINLLATNSGLIDSYKSMKLGLYINNNPKEIHQLFEQRYRILFKNAENFSALDFQYFIEDIVAVQKKAQRGLFEEKSIRDFHINLRMRLFILMVRISDFNIDFVMEFIQNNIPEILEYANENKDEIKAIHSNPYYLLFENGTDFGDREFKKFIFEIQHDLIKKGSNRGV